MHFILTGFTQDVGFRVFAFEGIAVDRIRTSFTVRADLALIRRYGIKIQELPLLCQSLLDRRDDGEEARALTFTEAEMRVCENERIAAQAEAASKRKRRNPSVDTLGAAGIGSPRTV